MSASPSVDQRKAALRVLQVLHQILAPCFFGNKYIPSLADLDPSTQTAFKNAVLDGSLVAIRAFNEFLGSRKCPDDLNQSDFAGLISAPQFLSKTDNKALHQTVAHLSKSYLDTDQAFPLKKYLLDALPTMISFCKFLETSSIPFSPREKQYVSDSLTMFVKLKVTWELAPSKP